jgi:hypothetical protein
VLDKNTPPPITSIPTTPPVAPLAVAESPETPLTNPQENKAS